MADKNSIFSCFKQFSMAAATLFLILLIIGDLSFVVLHMKNSLSDNWSELLSLDLDGSYAESFQYLKWIWIIALFIYIAIKRNFLGYLAWALVFTYFLMDDGLQLHENIGGWIANQLTFTAPFGLRLQDIGELAVTAVAGFLLLIVLAWAYFTSGLTFKKHSYDMLCLSLF